MTFFFVVDNNPKWYKATIYYSDNIRPPSVGCKLTFEGFEV